MPAGRRPSRGGLIFAGAAFVLLYGRISHYWS